MSTPGKPVISKENQPTALAVVFVLVLLVLSFSLYNYKQTRDVARFYGKLSIMLARKTATANENADRIAELERRLGVLEGRLAAIPQPTQPDQ